MSDISDSFGEQAAVRPRGANAQKAYLPNGKLYIIGVNITLVNS